MQGHFLPGWILVNQPVHGRKTPNLSALQPHELVGIVYLALLIQTGEIASMFFILAMLEPKWKHILDQFVMIKFRKVHYPARYTTAYFLYHWHELKNNRIKII
jgi:hypothetical protein